MRHSRLWLLLLVLAGSLLAWGVQWFLAHHERESREIRVDVSPQAKRNPLLAAQRFLRRLGIAAEAVTGRDQLLQPPQGPGALLVHRFGPSLPPAREQELVRWIERGGHLILTAERAWDEDAQTSGNRLLDRFGVRLRLVGEASEIDASEPVHPPALERVEFPGFRDPLAVAFVPERILEDPKGAAAWALPSRSAAHVLQLAVGKGRLSVLSDNRWMTNAAIGEADNALLLALLAGDAGRVWLLYNSRMPGLPELLWRFAPQLVVTLSVGLALWIWRLTLRIGPRLQARPSVRRNLLEHLDAAAAFAWRADRAERLLQHSRGALELAWRRRQRVLDMGTREAFCSRVARRSAVAPRAVEAAFYGSVANERDLVRVSAMLQRLAAVLRRPPGAAKERK
jgi:hypothetical protein